MIAVAMGFLLALIAPMAMISGQQAQAQEWSAPRTVYFPETGHSLDQVFLDYWREAGGASAFGYPITPEITQDDGTIIQYLQYARFEYYPNGNVAGNYFALGNIGEELRPFSLQRSVAAFTSTGSDHGTAAANSAEVTRAWLPVDAPETDSSHVRYVEETQHTVRYAFLDFWEATGGVDYLGNPLTEAYVIDGVTYQVFERGQVAWKNGSEAWLMPVGELLADKYKLSTEPVAQGDLPTYSEDLFVPPPTPTPDLPIAPANGERWIEINLSSQYLIAWQGDVPVIETYISSGRSGFDTPTGTFHVVVKMASDDMEGVLGGEYYNVPAVPDVMYFTDVGHAIHGTYWHNNFGAPMSHGCINVPMGTSAWLYDWTPMGARVVIHY
jgi:lipoprotein-anchoring transpeptidase ErfK/SrfK